MAQVPKALKNTAVAKVAFRHVHDFETGEPKRISGAAVNDLVALCITRAISALERDVPGYTPQQKHHISDVFKSLGSTHRTIRRLLNELTNDDPESVDALSLLRLQFEGLFLICLMLEDADYVDLYTRDYWRKSYAHYLLVKEECGALPSHQEYLVNALPDLVKLRDLFGLTTEHQATVDLEELGTPLPVAMTVQSIPRFPTPGQIPEKSANPDKKRMLERLHVRYHQLCSFSHVLGQANLLKAVFDKRFVHRNDGRISEQDVKDKFHGIVMTPANLNSCLCVVQAATELTTLYPNDLDLAAIVMRTWNTIAEGDALSRIVWAIRSEQLLGIIT